MQKFTVRKEVAIGLVRILSSDFALSKAGETRVQRAADRGVKQP
jgi:hypothetical protein